VLDKQTFIRRKGEKLDPEDDMRAYGRHFVGIAKLADFIMPTGKDEKEATLGKGTFGYVYRIDDIPASDKYSFPLLPSVL
jgi:hypothetical protein